VPARGSIWVPDKRGAPTLARLLLVLMVIVVVTTGCSGSDHSQATCSPITTEPLDPNFLIHVLPGAKRLHYRTDPPTSGPHQPSPHLARVQQRPLPEPVQVGLLEAGDVLVQYRQLRGADIARLRRLAGGHVVVAPNPDLSPRYRVVATGWIHKQTCTAVDTDALRRFVRLRGGKGAGAP
jgi:hypothetical protein